VRGSVATGKAKPPISDIDLVLVVDYERLDAAKGYFNAIVTDLVHKYAPDITEIDLTVTTIDVLLYDSDIKNLKIYMKYQSVLLRGVDILNELPGVYPGPYLAMYMYGDLESELKSLERQFSRIGEPKTYQNKERPDSFWCVWMMRTILRSAMALSMFEDSYFTQDLQECNRMAKKYYPELSDFLDESLRLAIEPSNDANYLLDFMHRYVAEYLQTWNRRRERWLVS